MTFALTKTLEILQRTPGVLHALLKGISNDWIMNNEGENTWSVFDVVGHLIVCEQTNFMTRAALILSSAENKTFVPIDMTAQFDASRGKPMGELLKLFEQCRNENVQKLIALNLTDADLQRTGVHPKMGEVVLSELLATWTAHDLSHLSQIARVMAKQYKHETGPFISFLSILK